MKVRAAVYASLDVALSSRKARTLRLNSKPWLRRRRFWVTLGTSRSYWDVAPSGRRLPAGRGRHRRGQEDSTIVLLPCDDRFYIWDHELRETEPIELIFDE